MSLKAGRVGVNPAQVNPVDGSILSSATSGYTKQEADAKFETQANAASTYETKSEASAALALKQPINLQLPIELLSGSALTVESALQGLNSEKFNYADNGVLGAKNRIIVPDQSISSEGVTATASNGIVTFSGTNGADTPIWYLIRDCKIPKGRYKFSGIDTSQSNLTTVELRKQSNDEVIGTITIDNGSTIIEITDDVLTCYLRCRVIAGANVTGVQIKAMATTPSDSDNTYQPYAMTNRELTDLETIKDSTVTTEETASGNYLRKIGRLVCLDLRLTGVTCSDWDSVGIIPEEFRPYQLVRTLSYAGKMVEITSAGLIKTQALSNDSFNIHAMWFTS